jgi:hypothetical protein
MHSHWTTRSGESAHVSAITALLFPPLGLSRNPLRRSIRTEASDGIIKVLLEMQIIDDDNVIPIAELEVELPIHVYTLVRE